MAKSVTTIISDELCPECQALYNMEIKLKKIISKFTYSKTVTITLPTTTNANGTTSGGGSQNFTISFTIENILYQCPSCKVIYDENLNLTSDAESYASKYDEYMAKYGLDPRRESDND